MLNEYWYHCWSANYTVSIDLLTTLKAIDVFDARAGLDLDERFQVSFFCKDRGDECVPTFVYNDPGDASAVGTARS